MRDLAAENMQLREQLRQAYQLLGEVGLERPLPLFKPNLETGEGLLGSRWLHNKRGSLYRIQSFATLQASGPVAEDDVLLVYRGEKDHAVWARKMQEFLDGRYTLQT